jgi:opacity protein-like surface antigen
MIPLSEEIEVAVLVGPTFYNIKQEFVETVSVQEGAAPYTTVSISGVTQVEQSETAVAFTAGLDGTYKLTPKFGIGAFFRYSGASADMPLSGGGTVTVEAGGIQIGGGLRYRF